MFRIGHCQRAALFAAALFLGGASARADAVKIASVFFSTTTTSQSNLRLINPTAATGNVTITIRNAAGTVLGSWTRAVAAGTAPQLTMKQIEDGAGVTPPAVVAGATNTATLEITSTFEGQLQHVVYNPVKGALTNISLCFNASTDTTNVSNVHTSLFASNYPSAVTITNTGAASAALILVTESLTGAAVGTYTSPSIAEGASLTIAEQDIETQLGFAPGSRLHLTLTLTGAFTGSLSHTVDNLIAGVMTDMTARCRLSPN